MKSTFGSIYKICMLLILEILVKNVVKNAKALKLHHGHFNYYIEIRA